MYIKPTTSYKTLQDTYQSFLAENRFKIQLITGEPGTGKTSLANLFMDEINSSSDKVIIVSGLCYIHSDYNIPYQPFKEILKELIQDVTREEQLSETKKSRSQTLKEALSFTAKAICDHAPDLIGSFVPGASVLSALGEHFFEPKENKGLIVEEVKILEQYLDVIKTIAEKYRIILFIDDLQWIDNLSVNLLYQLIKGLKNSPVMLIGNFRSTDLSLGGQNHPLTKLMTEVKINHGNVFIDLDKISNEEKKNLMLDILNEEANVYTPSFLDELFHHTQGNPLFVTELISLLKENNDIFLSENNEWTNNMDFSFHTYPAKIEGIIQERIGKLEDSLIETLSHASVQGNQFIAQVLSLTIGQSEKEVLMTLSKTLQKQHNLVNESNCFRNGQQIISKFNFSNYVFRQYLYQELSLTQKMILHSEVAGILEDIFKDNLNEVAEDIAHHYELSGELDKSLKYMPIVIDKMFRLSAFSEAETITNKALQYAQENNIVEHDGATYLELKYKKCMCLVSLRGWGDEELYETLVELKALSLQLSNFDHYQHILFGIWIVHLSRMEFELCLKEAEENIRFARQSENKIQEVIALNSVINTYFWTGEFNKAENSLQQVREILLENRISSFDYSFYLFLDYVVSIEKQDYQRIGTLKEEILRKIDSAKEYFTKTNLYQVLIWGGMFNNDLDTLRHYCPLLEEHATKANLIFYIAMSKIFAAYGMTDSDPNTAESLTKEGYHMLLKSNNSDVTVNHSLYGLTLCRIYLNSGQDSAFLSTMEEVLTVALQHNERCYLPDLYLLKHRYYQQKNQLIEAAVYLEKATTEATRSGSVRSMNNCSILVNN